MRKSVLRNDPGFDPAAAEWVVLLDGVQLDHCVTADEEKGEVWIYARHRPPEIGRDYRRLFGRVEILRQGRA